MKPQTRHALRHARNKALACMGAGVLCIAATIALDAPAGVIGFSSLLTLAACLAGVRAQLRLPR